MTDHPLKYEVVIYWSWDDQAFVAEVPELPGCAADGPTPREALASVEIIAREFQHFADALCGLAPRSKIRLPTSIARDT